MNTKSTKDYSIFREFASNREVDQRHVKKLIQAINAKNLLELHPILVDAEMHVIDGQHRLAAAEALGVEIFYQVSESISKADIANINSNSKNWTVMDYINYWTVENAPGFHTLSKFMNQHEYLKPTICIQLLSSDGSRDTKGLKSGQIDVTNIIEANQVVEVVKMFRNYVDFAFSRDFVFAVQKLIQTDCFDLEHMKRKLELQPRSLVKCISVKQYIEVIEEIYNYKSRDVVRFSKMI